MAEPAPKQDEGELDDYLDSLFLEFDETDEERASLRQAIEQAVEQWFSENEPQTLD